ncbi:hypothetical protein BDA99DRAFT_609407 [Phascolomyces articulosus]|uniref:Uncharacterized protein n=1 Tax=Phascolomyces articulosus TaxID=60185 RepID=A0AAD5P838_9FUNG|nr:hypothetical protein BDA99DRAFT_609407 [Phascolomyces articulosus]
MLRSSNTALRSLQWRSPLIALRHQSTATAAAAAPEVQQQQQPAQKQSSKRTPLSARLGGSGRGKTLEAGDPFSQFLNNAQQKNRRMQPRGKPRVNAAAPGQFDDATEQQPRKQQQQQRSKRQNKQQQQNKQKRQEASGATGTNDKQQQRSRQPRQVKSTRKVLETRRVTTFIDKDIDWTAMNTLEDQSNEAAAVSVASGEETTHEDREKLMMELQTGDYERYFQVSNGMEFGSTISADSLNSLMGGNASYAFDQKMAFLSAVSKASGGAVAAKK